MSNTNSITLDSIDLDLIMMALDMAARHCREISPGQDSYFQVKADAMDQLSQKIDKLPWPSYLIYALGPKSC